MSDKERGLYGKYYVKRKNDTTGKHDNCQYFVLDPQHDEFAVIALLAYAEACQEEYPLLSEDCLRLALLHEGSGPTQEDEEK